MGLPPPPPQTLMQSVTLLRDSLHRSQSTTLQMVSRLSTFDRRLSALDDAIRPVTAKASSMRRAHENIGKTLSTADAMLTRFDVIRQAEAKLSTRVRDDLEGFVVVIDLLKSNVDFFASCRSLRNAEAMGAQSKNLLAKAISKLEEEFRMVLSSNSMGLDPEHLPDYLSKSSESTPEVSDTSKMPTSNYGHQVKDRARLNHIPSKTLQLLHGLVQQLVQTGRQMQCLKIYRDIRSTSLEKSLQKLGVERLQKDEVKSMPWEVVEPKTRNWVRFFETAVKCHFFVERKVCSDIFNDVDTLRERCFAEVISNSVQVLIGFVEAVTESEIMPEKLFALLNMYKIMEELWPEVEMMFEGKACLVMRNSLSNLMRNLSQAIFRTLASLEGRIEEERIKERIKAPSDGKVHPMTSYVINYLKFLFDYLPVLKRIFGDSNNAGSKSNSQLETVIARIIQALEANLDATSKKCKDQALAHLFLMNNIHYIVLFVKGSEAKELLGNDWVDRHRKSVQQNATLYRRVAWAQVVATLNSQGLGLMGSDGGSSNTLKEAARERLRSFNAQFDELYQRQSHWAVRDQELADNLKLSVSEILLPAYRAFMQRVGPLIENSKNYEKFVKYTPEAIDRMVGELFQGGDR